MTLTEIYENLCAWDLRNPDTDHEFNREMEFEKPDDCYCDNCFYGRNELALEIIRLMGEE